jgi:hypothetical protein
MTSGRRDLGESEQTFSWQRGKAAHVLCDSGHYCLEARLAVAAPTAAELSESAPFGAELALTLSDVGRTTVLAEPV